MKISISTGTERKVSIDYQTWTYTSFFTEEIDAVNEDEVRRRRHHLKLLSQAAVYSDVLSDLPRLRRAVKDRPDIIAQIEMLENEANSGLNDATKALKEESSK
jgi:hypothetical protein